MVGSGVVWCLQTHKGSASGAQTGRARGDWSEGQMSLGFLGEFQHSLDAKGRVILPVEFREPLATGAVLTRVLDGCLAVYSEGEFELLAERMRESARQGARQRQAARAFFSSARHFVPDKQGRFAIPQAL